MSAAAADAVAATVVVVDVVVVVGVVVAAVVFDLFQAGEFFRLSLHHLAVSEIHLVNLTRSY